jgi:hypothetical protein
MSRIFLSLGLVLVLCHLAFAKDKEKPVLSSDVLRAQTVLVVIEPDAGEPLTNPDANSKCRDDVERALMKWGRFRLVIESQTADLIISVRKGTGRAVTPTISAGPVDNRPVILQPGEGGDIRIGGQRGHPPDVSQTGPDSPQNTGPRVKTEVGPSEDMFEVYRGRIDYPLDSPPVWRYIAKDGLRPPQVRAVDEFRKAIDQTEKAIDQKQQKKKP